MKYFRLLSLLAGMALAGFTSLVGQPVLRQSLTTNTAAAGQVNGDVPTWNAGLGRWDPQAPPGAGGGEANTIVNDGNGAGVYASKVGVALHLNTLTNTDGYIGIVSNASLLTFTFLQKDLYQHTNANLTLWQAIAPNAKQDASANLTLLSGYAPDAWQKTNANLTLWQAIAPSAKQDASANLTLLSGYAPDAWQKTNTVLTALTALTDPNANRILMWDDTDNAFVNVVIGANLTYTHASHTLSATGGAGTGDFMADGSVPMTGDLDMGGNNITNVGVMTMQSLYFLDGFVTNSMTASNVIANYRVVTTNINSTTNMWFSLNGTNLAVISGTNATFGFTHTPFILDDAGADYFITDSTSAQFAQKTNTVLVGDPTAPTPAGNDNDTSIATTAFVTASQVTFQNKIFDAAGTGNVLKQTKHLFLMRPDYGDGAGAVPQTNTFTASGLMHYTFSGSAETNVNWVVYETIVPPDIDTSVAMTATIAFISGGTDADAVTFHLTYSQAASGAAFPTGTGIATDPIVVTKTPDSPNTGDVQISAATTLTGWAGSMAAGQPLLIRMARLATSNTDTAREVYLDIAYGSTL